MILLSNSSTDTLFPSSRSTINGLEKPNENAGGAGGAGGKTNKAIATGGSKHNYITISLQSLIDKLEIKGNDFKENSRQLQDQSTDALLRTLALATTAGN